MATGADGIDDGEDQIGSLLREIMITRTSEAVATPIDRKVKCTTKCNNVFITLL